MKKSIQALLLLVSIVTLLPVQLYAGQPQLYQERLEVGRALLEVQFANVEEVLPYYTDDIEYHDPVVDIYGIEDMTGFLYRLLGAGNLVTIVEDEILVGDTYSATWLMTGDFFGVPYAAKGISIFKFERKSSMVYYQRDYYSEGDIMATIPSPDPEVPGLDEVILGFRTFYRCAVDPTFDCPFDGPPGESASELAFKTAESPKKQRGRGMSQRSPKAALGRNNRLRSPEQLRRAQLEIGRQLVEINAGNWPQVLPYLAENYEYHDPIVDIYGPDTMAEFLARLFAGSSDLYTTVEDESLDNGVYMATWTMAGEFGGAPFSAPGMSIVKFVDGSVQSDYSRDYYTEGDIMLGVPDLVPAVEGFRHFYQCVVDPRYTPSSEIIAMYGPCPDQLPAD